MNASQNITSDGAGNGEIKTSDGHVTWQRDDACELMIYRYYGEVVDLFFQEEMSSFWAGLPEVAHYNSLTDLREAEMKLSWPMIKELAKHVRDAAEGEPVSLKSALLVPVDHYDSTIKLLGVYFDHITFKKFLSEEEAMEWLLASAPKL